MALTVPVRNVNPMGDVTVFDPETGERHHVGAGEILTVTPELAEKLLEQVGNFEAINPDDSNPGDQDREPVETGPKAKGGTK